jgi:hypothetical protein
MRIIPASLVALSLLGCLAASWGEPQVEFEPWRRTANGWERNERFAPRIIPVHPPLHPAVVGSLEVLLVLMIATLSQSSNDWPIVRTPVTAIKPRRRKADRTLVFDTVAVIAGPPRSRAVRWNGVERRQLSTPSRRYTRAANSV